MIPTRSAPLVDLFASRMPWAWASGSMCRSAHLLERFGARSGFYDGCVVCEVGPPIRPRRAGRQDEVQGGQLSGRNGSGSTTFRRHRRAQIVARSVSHLRRISGRTRCCVEAAYVEMGDGALETDVLQWRQSLLD